MKMNSTKANFLNQCRVAAMVVVVLLSFGSNANAQKVTEVPAAVRAEFKLDEYYQKYAAVGKLPVVGSANVSDAAIREAAWIVNKMLGHRQDILEAMAENSTRLSVMAHNEYTTDVPEHRFLSDRAVYWNRRARGLGATRTAPAVSCGEENLLCHPNDPYWNENICIHEFAHAIHSMGMSTIDSSFDKRLKAAFKDSTEKGLWKNTYAASNHNEYWAEAVQCWFDDNRENDSLHNHINTRAELIDYDFGVAKLCKEVFGDRDWRYKKPLDRKKTDRAHLAGVDFENLPKFQWKKEPIPELAKIQIDTPQGTIELELDFKRAPITVENFLDYVHDGHYSNGQFYRSLTKDNQPETEIKVTGIQASANQNSKSDFPDPIKLERTSDTGLKHVDGTISMWREAGPDSATNHFFICIGDQSELDFGGKLTTDGQGFAAFGKVTKGMDIVRKIHSSPSEDQSLKPAIKIQRIVRGN